MNINNKVAPDEFVEINSDTTRLRKLTKKENTSTTNIITATTTKIRTTTATANITIATTTTINMTTTTTTKETISAITNNCADIVRKDAWDFLGSDLGSPVTAPDYATCCSICQTTAKCFAFSYTESTQNCWPKSSMKDGGESDETTVSGYNRKEQSFMTTLGNLEGLLEISVLKN
ncbi:unnamed protein product [Adineta steineri]|uniref:Apple domain-containing protein n=1 Tax=Adineta steineri TaxID=433720 RepID=A0A814G080_9BILA|nr:unnamed protein product [Adineta steineri]CAF1017361.1 unnamed protein product [Adineta steineri]CAF1066581.1 unnamed protein product [Adineta steineri]CAF3789961.1 unnamed protein product [Adineta steineri]CAF3934923.1 unnamed protein product [Adineta steineri]